MVEVDQCIALRQFPHQAGIGGPVGRLEFDQRHLAQFPRLGQFVAGEALHEPRVVRAEGLRGFEQEYRALADGQADEMALQGRRQFAAAHLQGGRAGAEGADQFGVVGQGHAVMQGEQAVFLDDFAHALSFSAKNSCCTMSSATPTEIAASATLNAGQCQPKACRSRKSTTAP